MTNRCPVKGRDPEVRGKAAQGYLWFFAVPGGDVILEFDGTRIEDDMHLINLVSLTPVHKEVDIRLLREGRPLILRVRVANRATMPSD